MCFCPWLSGLFPTQWILDLAAQPGLQDPDPAPRRQTLTPLLPCLSRKTHTSCAGPTSRPCREMSALRASAWTCCGSWLSCCASATACGWWRTGCTGHPSPTAPGRAWSASSSTGYGCSGPGLGKGAQPVGQRQVAGGSEGSLRTSLAHSRRGMSPWGLLTPMVYRAPVPVWWVTSYVPDICQMLPCATRA